MIKAISNVDEINKIIRSQLIIQSELDKNKVLNSVTAFGPQLDTLIQDAEYTSILPGNDILLFELTSRESDSDVSYMYKNSIQYSKSYLIKVIVYGNNSIDIVNKIVGRFRTEKVRYSLQQEGVYLESIEARGPISEFKNDRMWIRSDCDINVSCQFEIKEIEPEAEFTTISELITTSKIYN